MSHGAADIQQIRMLEFGMFYNATRIISPNNFQTLHEIGVWHSRDVNGVISLSRWSEIVPMLQSWKPFRHCQTIILPHRPPPLSHGIEQVSDE
jgi:hypothetical protein